jgi:hypothetical protein
VSVNPVGEFLLRVVVARSLRSRSAEPCRGCFDGRRLVCAGGRSGVFAAAGVDQTNEKNTGGNASDNLSLLRGGGIPAVLGLDGSLLNGGDGLFAVDVLPRVSL